MAVHAPGGADGGEEFVGGLRVDVSALHGVAGEGEAGFAFFEDNIGCAGVAEGFAFGEVACSDDDFDGGVDFAGGDDE